MRRVGRIVKPVNEPKKPQAKGAADPEKGAADNGKKE